MNPLSRNTAQRRIKTGKPADCPECKRLKRELVEANKLVSVILEDKYDSGECPLTDCCYKKITDSQIVKICGCDDSCPDEAMQENNPNINKEFIKNCWLKCFKQQDLTG